MSRSLIEETNENVTLVKIYQKSMTAKQITDMYAMNLKDFLTMIVLLSIGHYNVKFINHNS